MSVRVALLLITFLSAGSSVATPITWKFIGEIVSINRSVPTAFAGVTLSTPVVGSLSYDSTLIDIAPDSPRDDYFNAPTSAFAWSYRIGSTSANSTDSPLEFGSVQVSDNEALDTPYTRDRFSFLSATGFAQINVLLIDAMLDPSNGQPDAIEGLTGSPPTAIALEKFNCNGSGYTRVDGVSGSCASFANLFDATTGEQLGAVGFRITDLARVPVPPTLILIAAMLPFFRAFRC